MRCLKPELKGHIGPLEKQPCQPGTLIYFIYCLFTYYLSIYLFIYLRMLRLEARGILVPQSGTEPGPSAVKAQCPNHWTGQGIPNLGPF